ncbi:MAG: EAL domain-containing protein [Helicobacteraceae bacterium]|nr:EAL domain-containing protein [Helicobacteraceae bacterium]
MNSVRKLTLLYVHSEHEVFELLVNELNKSFEYVFTTNSAVEALKLYKDQRADLVIFDTHTADLEDIKICEEFRLLSPEQDIVIFSEVDDVELLKKIIELKVEKYIVKPYENIELVLEILKNIVIKINIKKELTTKNIELKKQYNELLKQKAFIEKHILLTYSDLDGNITYVSQAYLDLTGYEKSELIGKNHNVFKHYNAKEDAINELWHSAQLDEPWSGEFKNVKKDGTPFWVKVIIEPIYDDHNIKVGYSAVKEDISHQKKAEKLSITDPLTEVYNRRHFNTVLNEELTRSKRKGLNLCLIILDIDYFKQYNEHYGHDSGDDVLKWVSTQLKVSAGRGSDYLFRIGGEEFAIITSNMSDDDVRIYAENIRKSIENIKITHKFSKVSDFITASLGVINVDIKSSNLSTDDIYNITEHNLFNAQHNGKNRVIFNANQTTKTEICSIDKTTKLPDRIELFKAVENLKSNAMLMIISLNHFKHLLDEYSVKVIDAILIQKSKDIRRIILDKSTTLYKLNLNEFAILITDKSQFQKYLSILEYSLLQNKTCEFEFEGVNYNIVMNYTVGVAYGEEKILNHSDIALQKAHSTPKSFFIYEESENIKEIQNVKIDKLRVYKEALENDNIVPYFQPIVDINTGKTVKYEALARLIDSDGNVVSPFMFLDSSKEDKTYESFTRQMMNKVFAIYSKNSVNISVNLTYENIASKTMVEYIKNRLDKFGGEQITFEIVESEDIDDYKILEEFIIMVKSYGCEIAIDDFGSGYSNFTNLIKLNTNFLKLDGTIIENLSKDKNVETMAKALISFAKDTGIKTIAEYVSSKEIAQHVKELGIDLVQGYEYGKPEPADFYGLNI